MATTLPDVPNLKGVPYRITSLIEKSRIDSVRIRHIEVTTQEMAQQCRKLVIDGTEFGELARTVSLCSLTKDRGGDSGWLKTTSDFNSTMMMLPVELVNAALHMVNLPYPPTYPFIINLSADLFSHSIIPCHNDQNKGDLVVVSSSTSWHLLQLMDVNTALNPLLKRRRKDSYKAMKGYPGGDANEAEAVAAAYTYSIDTMGCQMNSADSERMEAQVHHTLHTIHNIKHIRS